MRRVCAESPIEKLAAAAVVGHRGGRGGLATGSVIPTVRAAASWRPVSSHFEGAPFQALELRAESLGHDRGLFPSPITSSLSRYPLTSLVGSGGSLGSYYRPS
jgi:hypothetical protein